MAGNHFTGTLRIAQPIELILNENLFKDIVVENDSILQYCDISGNPLLGNSNILQLTMCIQDGLYNSMQSYTQSVVSFDLNKTFTFARNLIKTSSSTTHSIKYLSTQKGSTGYKTLDQSVSNTKSYLTSTSQMKRTTSTLSFAKSSSSSSPVHYTTQTTKKSNKGEKYSSFNATVSQMFLIWSTTALVRLTSDIICLMFCFFLIRRYMGKAASTDTNWSVFE